MSAVIDRAFAREFAAWWIAAWNTGDLEHRPAFPRLSSWSTRARRGSSSSIRD